MEKQAHKLSITPAVRQDWSVIEKMFSAAFQTDIFFPLMKRRLYLAKKSSRFSKSIATLFAGNVYLLWSDNRPTGFIMLKKTGDKQMHLHYLAVASEFRRQGLGRELTGFAIKVANEYGADISLETEADSPAMKLYSSLGFSVDNQFHIYSLVSPSALPGGQETAVELLPVEDAKGMFMLAKEWLLGYKSSVLVCSPHEEISLSFRVCTPTLGGSEIIHCSLSGGSNELLYQTLPHLAFRMNNPGGDYLVLSVTDQANLDSPWLRDRTDYVTMIKKHRS